MGRRLFIPAVFMVATLWVASIWASDLRPWGGGLVLLLLALSLLSSLLLGQGSRPIGGWQWFALVATIYFAWRQLHSPVPDLARSDALLLGGGLGIYWWASSIATKRQVNLVIWGIAALVFLQAGVACIQQFFDPSFTVIGLGRKTTTFPSGLYAHYNHFANFLLGAMGLICGIALDVRTPKCKAILGCAFLVCVFGLVLAQSRGAFLAVAVAFAVGWVGWLLDAYRRKFQRCKLALAVTPIGIIVCCIAGARLTPVILKSRGFDQGVEVAMSDGGRYMYWSTASELIPEHPIVGGGARSFSYECFQKLTASSNAGDFVFAHNELLQVLTDYGLSGGALVVCFICGGALHGIIVLGVSTEQHLQGLTLGALCSIVGMFVQAMFSFVFHVMPDILLLGFSLAILTRFSPLSSIDSMEGCRFARVNLGVILVGILASGLIWLGWRDARIWWALRDENFELSERYENALKIIPDFRLAAELGKDKMQAARQSSGDKEAWKGAEALLGIATRSNPFDYVSLVNRAMVLDQLSEWESAADCYERLLPHMEYREAHYHVRFAQANHALSRGEQLWGERKPELALAWFFRARDSISRSFQLGNHSPEGYQLQDQVDRKIAFLEGAGIKPAELPPAKQWEFSPLGRDE